MRTRALLNKQRPFTTHFTVMCIPKLYFASKRRSTFDTGLVTQFGAFYLHFTVTNMDDSTCLSTTDK